MIAVIPAPFGNNPNLREFFVYYVNQNNSGNLKQAYCIQYGVEVFYGKPAFPGRTTITK